MERIIKRDDVSKPIDGDKRPVTCRFCGKKMYYIDHEKHEPEIYAQISGPCNLSEKFYAHIKCWEKILGE